MRGVALRAHEAVRNWLSVTGATPNFSMAMRAPQVGNESRGLQWYFADLAVAPWHV